VTGDGEPLDAPRLVPDPWDRVDEAFARLARYRVLHPTLAAMRKLVDAIRPDPAFVDAHPHVSHASLVLARSGSPRRVVVAWSEGLYRVAFIDPPWEFSEPAMLGEDAVVEAVRQHFAALGEP
jgi:hypothetical protein